MKRTQQFAVSVAGILLVGGVNQARADVITSFQAGSFAVNSWTIFDVESGPASASSPSPDTLTFTLPNTSLDTDSILTSPSEITPTTLNAILSLSQDGDQGSPNVYLYLTDSKGDTDSSQTFNPLVANGPSTVTESLDITIPAGDSLNFEMQGFGNSGSGLGPAVMDLTLIPEAGSWQAGAFLAGLLGMGMVRNLTAGTTKTQP